MTEQTRIPLPQTGDSLIERAVERFGWGQFAQQPVVPPVPASFAPATPAPAKPDPAPAAAQAAPVAPAPVAPAPVAVTSGAPTRMAESPIAPAPIAAPASTLVAAGARQVDREHLRRHGFIVPEGKVTATLEEFRIVKRQLLLQAADLRRQAGDAGTGWARRVLICSPHPGEGKTYCAVNLALAIAAEKESEVLLVDADFAKPSVPAALGIESGQGLMDALADPALDVADLVLATDVPGLKVLPAGGATNRDSEHLSSSRTAQVLDRLTEGAPHRMVIFDSPPALAASPAAELAKYVGQALVICRADRTGQQSLEDAVSLLSGCPNIQLLLNATSFSPSGRRFGDYYGYGA